MTRLSTITATMYNDTNNIKSILTTLNATLRQMVVVTNNQTNIINDTKNLCKDQGNIASRLIRDHIRKCKDEQNAKDNKKEECIASSFTPQLKEEIKRESALNAQECCFHPETLIKNNDGKNIAIKNIKVGTYLKNGEKVLATMILDNTNKDMTYREPLFIIPNGENNQDIIVSGSHLIFDVSINNFIKVKDSSISKKSYINSEILICLITTDHTIPLGENIFHDWEDNNGSRSKDI